MRKLALALLGFSLLNGPAAARGDGSSSSRRAEAKGVGSARAERAFLVRRVASHASRSVPSGLACARTRGGATQRCRGAFHAVHWRWSQGLPPALGVQAQECPAGTMATLAEGHDDIVRCIPI
jgi:hypothetical protein